MLGQAISMLLPEVIGYHITGSLDQYATSTDLVLTITKVEIHAFTTIIDYLIYLFAAFATNWCCGKIRWVLRPGRGCPFHRRQSYYFQHVPWVRSHRWLLPSGWSNPCLPQANKWVFTLLLFGFVLNYNSFVSDRAEDKITAIEAYLRASKMMRNYSDSKQDPKFTQVLGYNLNLVEHKT